MTVDRTPPGQRPATTDGTPVAGPAPSRRRWWGVGVLLLLVVILFTSCMANAFRSTSSAGESSEVSKYVQTWPEDYSSTTCSEWNTEMTDQQQFAAAADMLSGARDKGDGGTGVAPDALIENFQGGVTRSCVMPTASLAEVGAGLYLTERDTFRP